jgi:hypothetical protein
MNDLAPGAAYSMPTVRQGASDLVRDGTLFPEHPFMILFCPLASPLSFSFSIIFCSRCTSRCAARTAGPPFLILIPFVSHLFYVQTYQA